MCVCVYSLHCEIINDWMKIFLCSSSLFINDDDDEQQTKYLNRIAMLIIIIMMMTTIKFSFFFLLSGLILFISFDSVSYLFFPSNRANSITIISNFSKSATNRIRWWCWWGLGICIFFQILIIFFGIKRLGIKKKHTQTFTFFFIIILYV